MYDEYKNNEEYYDDLNLKDKNKIKGYYVEHVWVNSDESILLFDCGKDKNFALHVTGDCCSESWWADIYQLDNLRGYHINRVNELWIKYNIGDDGRSRQEEDKVYGYDIITTRGTTTLAFRNSSNGYYGGECELKLYSDDELVGLLGKDKWREIEGNDWQG